MPLSFTSVPGYVSLLSASGDDTTIVNAAVVSNGYTGKIEPEVKHERLMEEMIRSGHWGCLDHCFLTFKIKTPIFVARQIMRSSGMNFNELSMRYLESDGLCYIPEYFYKDVKRKDLGKEPEMAPDWNGSLYKNAIEEAWSYYVDLLKNGIRKEQARMVLPVSMFTEFWASARLSDWLHFLNLRLDKHAQLETQFVAKMIEEEIKETYPKTHELWCKYARCPINEHGTIQTP